MPGMAAQPRRIVLGYDASPAGRRALDVAADLTGYGSTLTVVTVSTENERDDTALAEARDRLLRQQVLARYVRAVGDPANELVAAARELEADLVIVGRRNGGFDATVVRQAGCDVLVVAARS